MRILRQLLLLTALVPQFLSVPSLVVFPQDLQKTPAGNHIASYFHHCLTHIVEFSAHVPFNFRTPDVPRTSYTYPSSFLNNYTVHVEVTKDVNRRTRQIRHGLQKLQSFKCMLTMISELEGTVDFSDRLITLYNILSQDNVLWYESSNLKQIMPQYFVVFALSDKSLGSEGRSSFENFTHSLVSKMIPGKYAALLPAVFTLQVDSSHGGNHLNGFLYCWFCAKDNERPEFSCKNSADCPAKMMETYLHMVAKSLRDIPWVYRKKGKWVTTLGMNKLCPLTLGQNSSCLAEEIEYVTSFLMEGSNRSAVNSVLRKSWNGLPSATYNRAAPSQHAIKLISVGRSVRFRFITADGIQSDRASFATFLAPFSTNMWLALGITMILLAIFVAAMSSLPFLWALPRSIISVSAPMVDKVIVDRISRTRCSHGLGFIMTCWTFVAIVVTTCYKSIMKSNYMTEEKFGTRWKSFKEIKNFTLIYAEGINDEQWHKAIEDSFQSWKKKLSASECDEECVRHHEHLFWQPYCVVFPESADDRSACEIFRLAYNSKHVCTTKTCPDNEKYKEWPSRRTSLLQNMASDGRIRAFGRIQDIIRQELFQPRTAFVSPAETFDTDWKIFEEESRTLRVRFSHSEYAEDFGGMFGYELTSGFNEHVGKAMDLRGDMILQSGVFWLWEKWEKYRQDFRNRNTLAVGKAFVEISFTNSDVHLTFAVYLIGVLVAVLIFGTESSRSRGLRRL